MPSILSVLQLIFSHETGAVAIFTGTILLGEGLWFACLRVCPPAYIDMVQEQLRAMWALWIHADFVICVHLKWNIDTSMYLQCFRKNVPVWGHYSPMDAIGFAPRALSTAGYFLFAHWILHEPVPCESRHQGWGENSCGHAGFNKIGVLICWWPGFMSPFHTGGKCHKVSP